MKPDAEQGRLSRRAIHYIQYANPAALPILEHSGLIFIGAGYAVSYVGVVEPEIKDRLASHADLADRTKLWLSVPPGWRQKLHYLLFALANVWLVVRQRDGWVYASDLNSCLAGYLIQRLKLARTIYHEHDSPVEPAEGHKTIGRFLLSLRSRVARQAELAILPNPERARLFNELRAPEQPALVVLNCPRLEDLGTVRPPWRGGPLRVLYHGSIVPPRLPMSVIDAVARLSGRVTLSIVGYVPIGVGDYLNQLLARAAELGAQDHVQSIGVIPARSDLLAYAATQDVGLAFMPTETDDVNMRYMAGASNKPFDYLAVGVALLVSDRPDWREFYVEPGYALACDPHDAKSLVHAFETFLDDPTRMRAMGERGRQRIQSDWNYESQFAPVLQAVESLTRSRS